LVQPAHRRLHRPRQHTPLRRRRDDTPTDSRPRHELIDLLKTFEHTHIITTHDLDLALQVCPRTIVLGRGKTLPPPPSWPKADSKKPSPCHENKPYSRFFPDFEKNV
jgi:energy-coupling factor transporter ATP-binding protein EcfA2